MSQRGMRRCSPRPFLATYIATRQFGNEVPDAASNRDKDMVGTPSTHALVDSLMALGCGRLFEGTPDQMYASLSKLAALPPETTVCSGHEYTASNAKFALTVDPGNAQLISRDAAIAQARAAGQPTVPSLLSQELATNPFLRCHTEGVQKAVNMIGADPALVFAEVRKRKDNF